MSRSRKSATNRLKPRKKSFVTTFDEIAKLTLPPRRVRYHVRANREDKSRDGSPHRRKRLSDTLYHPHSKTLLAKRRTKTLVPHVRTYAGITIPGISRGHARKRTLCDDRASRKTVLFTKKLIGFAGSSPGKRRTYKRRTDSQYSCR